MRSIKITKNPFLLFSPFLLLYVILVLVLPTHGTVGDENRYLMFSHNLLHGFYSPPPPGIDIGDGPGYPIVLMPFLALSLPLLCITLLNAVFYYLSIIFLFKSLQQVASFPLSLILSLFWACYYNSYENVPLTISETFTAFLISILVFNILRAFNPQNLKGQNKYLYISGFLIGYIALTKVIFGYVLLFMLAAGLLLWLISTSKVNYKKVVIVFFTALITTTPYLIYTYHVTHKIFYWGTTGGENLYWMSTPFEGEYGSWVQYPMDPKIKRNTIPEAYELISKNHQAELDEIFKYKGVQKDSAYKKMAVNNIMSYPVKFVKNCISNVGRMLFNYPYSYTLQKNATLLRLPLNGILLVLMLFCVIPTFIKWRQTIFTVRLLLFFFLLYFGGSMLASAETRMFTVIVPVLLFWIAYTLQKFIKLNLNEGQV